jgi:hypothetical protein
MKAWSISLRPFFWRPALPIYFSLTFVKKSATYLSTIALVSSSLMLASLAWAFSLLVVFGFSLVVALT